MIVAWTVHGAVKSNTKEVVISEILIGERFGSERDFNFQFCGIQGRPPLAESFL